MIKYMSISFLVLVSFVYIKLKQDNYIKDIKVENKNNIENASTNQSCNGKYNILTKEEEAVIKYGKTEKPFTGSLLYNKEKGYYLCKQCNALLFESDAKFDSKTGWPSFDKAVANAIEYVKDGTRTEVKCRKCGAHLGHVFYGEGFTEKNARYCVNSISLKFESKK